MDDPSFAQTLEARFAAEPDMARTLVQRPGSTIEPPQPISSGAIAALDALRALGATLGGRIDLHDTLGEGGMGVVHLATQTTLGRHVAVKTLRAGVTGADASLRILREAWVTGALEHPNVVPVHDVGIDAGGSPVIVMKRIEGLSWADLIHDPAEVARRFAVTDPLEWNLRTLVSVSNAVHFAHSRGILHRDLKPENVMIGQFGEVYVVDWGIAVTLTADPSGRLPPASQAKDIAGTPHYMAPEMLLGDPAMLSPRTDVYLLGAIFYEIVSGEPPHRGDNLRAMMTDILPLRPHVPAPTLPPRGAPHLRARAQPRPGRSPGERRGASPRDRGVPASPGLAEARARREAEPRPARGGDRQRRARLRPRDHDREPARRVPLRVPRRAVGVGGQRRGEKGARSRAPPRGRARARRRGRGRGGHAPSRRVGAAGGRRGARVETAVRARSTEEERLRHLEEDQDPGVGSRTRLFLGGIFGLVWTASPLFGWAYAPSAERTARTSRR